MSDEYARHEWQGPAIRYPDTDWLARVRAAVLQALLPFPEASAAAREALDTFDTDVVPNDVMWFDFAPKNRWTPFVSIEVRPEPKTGDLVVSGIAVKAFTKFRSRVTAADLRALRPDQFLNDARSLAHVMTRPETDNPLPDWWLEEGAHAEGLEQMLVELARKRRPEEAGGSRRGLGEDHYRWVAVTYLVLYRSGIAYGIGQALVDRASEELGMEISRSQARDWVKRARDLGFLTPGTQGQAGGGPGPRLPLADLYEVDRRVEASTERKGSTE